MSGVNVARCVVALCSLVVFGACNEDEDLFIICPETCYAGPEGTAGVGLCRAGVPTCDEEGNVLACDGEVLPSYERCNGEDDDCDGDVDERLSISPSDQDNACKQCGACYRTYEVCDNGAWSCNYDYPPTATDGVCDGIDSDCDCVVDEDVYLEGEVVFCYHGPAGTVANGECRPGLEACDNGQIVCEGEVTPRNETCDGTDQDCNGWIDDVTDLYQGIDLIFAIDISGSMGPYVEAVTNVVCDYAAATEGRDDLSTKMGLVLIAQPDGSFSLEHNLTDAQTLCEVLQDVAFGGGSEPTISTARAVVSPWNPLLIDWTDSSKRIFVGFGDENAQSVCNTTFGVGCTVEEEVVDTLAFCVETNTDVYWFVGGSPEFYMEQAFGCNGDIFWLTEYEEFMMNDLNSILEEVCLEEEPAP